MATKQDYTSDKVCEQTSLAFGSLESSKGVFESNGIGEAILKRANQSEPKKISYEEAIRLIQKSSLCAIGERVCLSIKSINNLSGYKGRT